MNESAPQGEPRNVYDDCECTRCVAARDATQAAPSVAAPAGMVLAGELRYCYGYDVLWRKEFIDAHPPGDEPWSVKLYAALPLPAVVQAEPARLKAEAWLRSLGGKFLGDGIAESWRASDLLVALANQAVPHSTQPAAPQLDTQRATEGMPAPVEREAWRCFHCDEAFTDRGAAADHFGTSEHQQPMCTISPEHFRWMEAQHRRNVDDDSEALRTIRGLIGEHETLRARAEEEGYAKGLRDGANLPPDSPERAALATSPATASPVVHPAGERTASSEGPALAPSGYLAVPDEQDGASPPIQQGVVEALKDCIAALGGIRSDNVPDTARAALASLRATSGENGNG